jgi:hypothetical protein
MYATATNQLTALKIKKNDRKMIANTDSSYSQDSGVLHGGEILKHCTQCGGKIRMAKVVKDLKAVGRAAKPIAHQLINTGAVALGTALTENPAIGAVAGKTLGKIGTDLYDKAVGGKIKAKRSSKHKKGSKSVTHKGDLDYTTKLGDEFYHIGGHDVKKATSPFVGSGIKGSPSLTHPGDQDYTTKKGDSDYHEAGKNIKKSNKPFSSWIQHVKKFASDNNMKYGDALKSAECKSSYHKSK